MLSCLFILKNFNNIHHPMTIEWLQRCPLYLYNIVYKIFGLRFFNCNIFIITLVPGPMLNFWWQYWRLEFSLQEFLGSSMLLNVFLLVLSSPSNVNFYCLTQLWSTPWSPLEDLQKGNIFRNVGILTRIAHHNLAHLTLTKIFPLLLWLLFQFHVRFHY